VGPPDKRVGYFNQMMKLTGELLTEKLKLEEYEKSIQWATEAMDDMSRSMEPIEQQIKAFGFDDLALSMMNRPLKSFKEGIQTFHEGLEKLRFYVYEQTQSHLQNGLTLLEKANNLFNYTADTASYMIGNIAKELTPEQVSQVEKDVEERMAKRS
jgi:cob(I)alamin adenosyltransferase